MQIEACLNPDRTSRRRVSTFQVGDKNLTFPANLHFLGPTRFRLSLADRPIDEPADVPRSEFPGRAGFSGWGRATSNLPAGSSIFIASIFHSRQKKASAAQYAPEPSAIPVRSFESPGEIHRGVGTFVFGFFQASGEKHKIPWRPWAPFLSGILQFEAPKNFFLTIYTTMCYLGNDFLSGKI